SVLMSQFYETYDQRGKYPISFFSQHGLEHFWTTGKIFEQTGMFLNPVGEEQRREMLGQFVEKSRAKKIESHMIRDKKMKIPGSIMLEIFGTNKLMLFHSQEPMSFSFIQINESSICEAFQDFMEYIARSDITMSMEDTFSYMESKIKEEKGM
ncbi:MAG: hypothetical protein Q4B70_12085, partial [Lachnospiraceae bacterium]|nr:hypothetical protein [Lachnospiraceae bacterium]